MKGILASFFLALTFCVFGEGRCFFTMETPAAIKESLSYDVVAVGVRKNGYCLVGRLQPLGVFTSALLTPGSDSSCSNTSNSVKLSKPGTDGIQFATLSITGSCWSTPVDEYFAPKYFSFGGKTFKGDYQTFGMDKSSSSTTTVVLSLEPGLPILAVA